MQLSSLWREYSLLESPPACMCIIDFWHRIFFSHLPKCVSVMHVTCMLISIFHLDYLNFSLNTFLLILSCSLSQLSNHTHSNPLFFTCIFTEKPKYSSILRAHSKDIPKVKKYNIFFTRASYTLQMQTYIPMRNTIHVSYIVSYRACHNKKIFFFCL